jgi:hypothetical protein
MINENRQLTQDFMKQLSSIFPKIYAFDRKTLSINEITENTNEFIKNNLLNGCVDDLVCSFTDLPQAGEWFKLHNPQVHRAASIIAWITLAKL